MSNLVKNMSAFDSFIRLKYKEGVWWNYGKPTHPLYADLWDAWQARVPEGYVVVPVEPTEDMIMAGCMEHGGYDVIDSKSIYKAMIEAQEQSHD